MHVLSRIYVCIRIPVYQYTTIPLYSLLLNPWSAWLCDILHFQRLTKASNNHSHCEDQSNHTRNSWFFRQGRKEGRNRINPSNYIFTIYRIYYYNSIMLHDHVARSCCMCIAITNVALIRKLTTQSRRTACVACCVVFSFFFSFLSLSFFTYLVQIQ